MVKERRVHYALKAVFTEDQAKGESETHRQDPWLLGYYSNLVRTSPATSWILVKRRALRGGEGEFQNLEMRDLYV